MLINVNFFLHFLYVERASQSLGPLRYALNLPVKSPASKRSIYKGDDYSSAGIENIYLKVLQFSMSIYTSPVSTCTVGLIDARRNSDV